MRRKFKILARHKWVLGCTITESCSIEDGSYRRFTATIDGWQGFKIYEGYIVDNGNLVDSVISRVRSIKQRIREGDNIVFHENTMLFCVK